LTYVLAGIVNPSEVMLKTPTKLVTDHDAKTAESSPAMHRRRRRREQVARYAFVGQDTVIAKAGHPLAREASSISMMPEGLLGTASRPTKSATLLAYLQPTQQVPVP